MERHEVIINMVATKINDVRSRIELSKETKGTNPSNPFENAISTVNVRALRHDVDRSLLLFNQIYSNVVTSQILYF